MHGGLTTDRFGSREFATGFPYYFLAAKGRIEAEVCRTSARMAVFLSDNAFTSSRELLAAGRSMKEQATPRRLHIGFRRHEAFPRRRIARETGGVEPGRALYRSGPLGTD